MVDEVGKVAISVDASGVETGLQQAERTVPGFVAVERGITASFEGIGGAAERQAVKVAESMARQVRALDAMQRRYDPVGAQVRAIEKDIERLDATIAKGGPEAVRSIDLKIRAMAQLNEVSNRSANEAIAAAAAQSRALDEAAQKVRDQVNPIAAAYRAQGEEIARLQALRQAQKLTEAELTAATTALTSATAAQVAELDGSAAAARAAAKADAELTAQARQFIAVADPAAAAQAQFAEKTAVANQLLAAGKISAAQHSAGLAALREEHARAASGVSQTSGVMRQFGVQSIDVFQQLASGAPVMTTLIQQGGQMAQVVGSTGGAMGMLRAAASALVSPVGLATAGVVAFGVAAGVALSKASTMADETRALSVDIAAVGRSAELSAGQLQTYVTALARQGVARADANAIVGQLSRTTLTQPQIQQVVELTPDASVALGVDQKQAAKELAEAVNGSYAAIKRFDDALNILTVTEREAVRTMLEHGDKTNAVGLAIDALRSRIKGAEEQSLSPMGRAIRELANGWDDFLNRVAKSDIVTSVMEKVRKGVLSVSAAMKTASLDVQADDLNAKILTVQSQIAEAGQPRQGTVGALQLESLRAYYKQLLADLDAVNAKTKALNPGAGQLPPLPPSIVVGGKSTSEAEREAQNKLLEESTKGLRENDAVLRASLPTRAAVRAAMEAQNDVLRLGLKDEWAAEYIRRKVAAATLESSDAAVQNAAAIQRQTEAGIAQAAAADNGRAAMLRAAAAAQAYDAAATQAGVSEDELTEAILNRDAAQEASKAASTIVDLRDQITASEGLAKATSQTALWYAELANDVQAATKSLKAYMEVATDPALKKRLADQIKDISTGIGQRKEVNGAEALNRATMEANTAAEAQTRILAAYDGTAQSLVRARNEQTAYGLALQKMRPDQDGFADAVSRYADALNRSSDATAQLQQAEQSVQAVTDTLGTAFDRVGQGLVDAALTGQNALLSLANIGKAVASSILADFAKFAFANPFKNWALGTTSPTLGGALGAFVGGGGSAADGSRSAGGSDLMGNASNLLTLGSLGDKLGLTNIKSMFSGIGDAIYGPTSLLNSVLTTGINGTTLATATNTAIAGIPLAPGAAVPGAAVQGPATQAAVSGLQGGATIGQFAGGVGAGFGLGSMAGGFVQNSLGKVGPAPMIGAGAGALAGAAIGSFVPVIGTMVGGIIGGLVGGGGGGLIGPKAPSAFSSTGVSLENGRLALGQTVSQIADTAQEVANAAQQLAQINTFLSQSGVTIATLGQLSQIGQNTPGGTPDPTKFADVASGFSQLRFTSDDPIKAAALTDKTFGSLEELAAALDKVTASTAQTKAFLDDTVPALLKAADGTQAFAQQLAGVSQPYDDAIAQAKAMAEQAGQTAERITQLGQAQTDLSDARTKALTKTIDDAMAALVPSDGGELAARIAEIGKTYGTAIDSIKVAAAKAGDVGAVTDRLAKAEADLVAARDKATAAANDAATEATRATERALLLRTLGAQAEIGGDPFQTQSVKTMALGEQQRLEARAFDQQLTATYGEAFRDTADYAQRMTALERAQQAERLSSQEEFARRMVAIERSLVTQIYSLQGRQATADAAVSGQPWRVQAAALQNFDEQARVQRQAQDQSLVDTYGDGVRQTQLYADVMRQVDDTLYSERLALQKQFADQSLQVARNWLTQLNSLTIRQATAQAAVSGEPGRVQSAALDAFDEQARITRLSYEQQLVDNNGPAVRQTQMFADVMRQVDATLYAERLALQKQYADQSVAQDKARLDTLNALLVRRDTASASSSGDPVQAQAAALRAFDEQARLERQSIDANLASTLGAAIRQTEYYAAFMREVDSTLYAERLALQKQYADQSAAQERARVDQAQSLTIRKATAEAAVSGDPTRIQAAALRAFDEQARLERQATDQGLVSTFGEGVRQTQLYVQTMTQLDQTLYAERLALQKQYADQSLDAQRSAAQTASGIVVSLTEYVRGLQTGPNSALSTQAKYDLASRQFEVTRAAAAGGDLRALQNLTSYADTLVTASRGMFGSGVRYVQDIDRIVDAIGQIALQPPEVLSNLVFVAEMRGQTQTLVQELGDRLDDLIAEVTALRRAQAHAAGAPPAARAA